MAERQWRFLQRGSRTSWIVACTLTVLTLAAFYWPAASLPQVVTVLWDKLVHAGLFFVLTIAWLRTGLETRKAVTLMIGLIFVTEIGQEILPVARYAELTDAIADVVGITAALVLWGMAERVRPQSRTL